MNNIKKVNVEDIPKEALEALSLLDTPLEDKMKTWCHQIIEVDRKNNSIYTASCPVGKFHKNYFFPLDKFEKLFKIKLENGHHGFTRLRLGGQNNE